MVKYSSVRAQINQSFCIKQQQSCFFSCMRARMWHLIYIWSGGALSFIDYFWSVSATCFCLSTAGVNVSKFKGHCTRAAWTSFLACHNISIEEIGFGPNFLQWIRTFYRSLSSCVLNNGFTTDIFFVKRGVRQGDPLSPLLFILALETLVCQIQENENIVFCYRS